MPAFSPTLEVRRSLVSSSLRSSEEYPYVGLTKGKGPCVCEHTAADPVCSMDESYSLCLAEVKRDLVTATAAIAAISSFCMGLFANL